MWTSANTTPARMADAVLTWWTTSTASASTTGRARPAIPVSYVDSVLMCVFMFGVRCSPSATMIQIFCVFWHTETSHFVVFSSHMWVVRALVTSVFRCTSGQVRASVTQPPAVTEAPVMTTVIPFSALVHLDGKETHATQVRPQDGVWCGLMMMVLHFLQLFRQSFKCWVDWRS